MANPDAAFGLRPVRHINGSAWNGLVQMYLYTAANTLFVGDPVKLAGSSGAAGTVVNGIDVEGMATIMRPAAGDALLGVVVGFLPLQSNLEVLHAQASVNRIALVVTDPTVVYEIQEDSDTNDMDADMVGLSTDMITYAAGSTTTGRSIIELDSSDTATAAGQFRILGLTKRPGNAIGTNAVWDVMINEHQLLTSTDV